VCCALLSRPQSAWQYIAQSIDNPTLEATASILVDIIMPPVPVDDVITLSPWLIEQSQEVVLDRLLNNDFDNNTRISDTLPLRIESASCKGRSQCTIEDGTQIRIQLRGVEVSCACIYQAEHD
jgi:hypothetical protein